MHATERSRHLIKACATTIPLRSQIKLESRLFRAPCRPHVTSSVLLLNQSKEFRVTLNGSPEVSDNFSCYCLITILVLHREKLCDVPTARKESHYVDAFGQPQKQIKFCRVDKA